MHPITELLVRCAVALAIGCTLCVCFYLALATFMWWWLAALCAWLLTGLAGQVEIAQTVTTRAGDLAVNGCATALNAFRGLRARLGR